MDCYGNLDLSLNICGHEFHRRSKGNDNICGKQRFRYVFLQDLLFKTF